MLAELMYPTALLQAILLLNIVRVCYNNEDHLFKMCSHCFFLALNNSVIVLTREFVFRFLWYDMITRTILLQAFTY